MAQLRRCNASKMLQVIALSVSLLTMERLAMSQLPTATILGAVNSWKVAILPVSKMVAEMVATGRTFDVVSWLEWGMEAVCCGEI